MLEQEESSCHFLYRCELTGVKRVGPVHSDWDRTISNSHSPNTLLRPFGEDISLYENILKHTQFTDVRPVFHVRSQNCVVMSVCPSVRTEKLGSHCTDFDYIWYPSFSWKYVQKVQVSFKSHNNVYFTYERLHTSRRFFVKWETFQIKVVGRIKTEFYVQ
jgi:hypothetical protein